MVSPLVTGVARFRVTVLPLMVRLLTVIGVPLTLTTKLPVAGGLAASRGSSEVSTRLLPSVLVSALTNVGAVVSTVMVRLSVLMLPAGSVAVTVMVVLPSASGGRTLSARDQVPSPLLMAA